MVLDERLLRQVREAGNRVAEAEGALETAQCDFKASVRRLHEAGGSLREIAAELALSHQRVHQLVDGRPRRLSLGRGRRQQQNLALRSCSFCGTGQRATKRLVAGPNVFICHSCVALAAGVVAAGGEAANERVRLEAVGRDAASSCSFCGKAAARVRHRLVAGPGVTICGECVDLCREIIAEETSTGS
jgi:hypothetical protein